ncbi:MAG: hypothetical protein Fur0018_02010 [Anaerolineales bacterium]
MKMKRILPFLLTLTIFLPLWGVHAQTEGAPQLQFSLRRDWGYGGLNGQIQGHFTARVKGRDDLSRVVFYLDEQVMAEVDAPPFELRFVTDSYPLGKHMLYAVGYTARGQEMLSNVVYAEFVSAEQGWQEARRMIIPLLAIIFGGMLLTAAITWFAEQRRGPVPAGAPRTYGILGGAVCPKCGRPFSRHWWAPNILSGKFDRCPHCGKWSLVRMASRHDLRAAEQAELEAAQFAAISAQTETQQHQRELDESRYLDE